MSDRLKQARQIMDNTVHARDDETYRRNVVAAFELLHWEMERMDAELEALKAKSS